MQRKKMTKLDDAISEIKKLAKEFREKNGNSSLRIPNKDFNLWIVNKMLEQDGRISKIEAKQMAFIVLVTMFAAGITIFRVI